MYNAIYNIIEHTWATSDSMQSYITNTCCALIIILTVVFVDMIYKIFAKIWRG